MHNKNSHLTCFCGFAFVQRSHKTKSAPAGRCCKRYVFTMMNKLLILSLALLVSYPALSSECKYDHMDVRELEGYKLSEFDDGITQIDVKVPESIDGMAFYSSQLIQEQPLMFIHISLPFRKEGMLVGQFLLATEVLSEPEVQVFYGSPECGILLKKKINITNAVNRNG